MGERERERENKRDREQGRERVCERETHFEKHLIAQPHHFTLQCIIVRLDAMTVFSYVGQVVFCTARDYSVSRVR